MKAILSIALTFSIVFFGGCSKTDNAKAWVGTYTGSGLTNTVNQVTISEVNSTTLQIQLQVNYAGSAYTYATMQMAKLQNATTVNINETGPLYGYTDQFAYTGTGTLSNGNSLTLAGQGKDVVTDSIKYYYFVGSK